MRTLLVLSAILGLAAIGRAQSRWYVDDSATGANTGTSWRDAFTDLQSALAVADGTDKVWVAAGTYRPSSSGDRTASFRPREGISVFGGFAGTESSLAERAGLFDRTVLSGDLAGDDGPGFANRSDNSEHIVVTSGFLFSTFDGFRLRGGNAQDSPGGGAWYSPEFPSNFAVAHCTFEDNEGRLAGGAVYTGQDSADSFTDCLFVGNRASTGGAAYRWPQDKVGLLLVRCRFLGNHATGRGGGALAAYGYMAFGCLFAGNGADGTSGGGGAILGGGTLDSCTVSGNHAFGGPLVGGIHGSVSPQASILWGNLDDRGAVLDSQISGLEGLKYTVGCCLQGWTPDLDGERMIASDPEFEDPLGPDGVEGTLDDDFGLGALSPCVDVLPPDPYAHVDVGGRPRNVEARACAAGILDLGALERQASDPYPTFCPATNSSLGRPAEIETSCLLELGGGPVEVRVLFVPDALGMLVLGDSRIQVRFGNGYLCVGEAVRASSVRVAQGNELDFRLDPATAAGGVITAGSTWNLQAIYRDPGAGGGGFNTSDAIAITVLP